MPETVGQDATTRLVREHPEVLEYRCLPRTETANQLAIVRSTGFLTGAELRRHVLERGGPTALDVLVVDEMPNLAIDTGNPATITESVAGTMYAFAPPSDVVERALVDIWEDVLDFRPVGVLDDFVDVGGDSLAAVEVAGAIAQRWNVDIELVDLVDTGTVRELARLIGGTDRTTP